ncbi:MAG: FTR1 family iron permease [Succinivibrionaceae bacterium]|nr:FTR1 family iron permease [Succinivibrionaceae bacterium]
MIRKFLIVFTALLLATGAFAAKYASWKQVADDMKVHLDNAAALAAEGKSREAKDEVNVAYFRFYEKIGFERVTKSSISGNRASAVEYQFSTVKKSILKGEDETVVRGHLDKLAAMLYEDAATLDGSRKSSQKDAGKADNASASSTSSTSSTSAVDQGDDASGVMAEAGSFWSTFTASFFIILREGFEAILIVGAILAYLVKTGNGHRQKPVIWGSVLAVGASFIMAWILDAVAENSGQNQEIIEGVTMLVAVAVLFYVSNFMMAKADAAAWQGYIQGRVSSSIKTGGMFALAFTAFLAVFREGAEVILFYQALLAGTTDSSGVWYGFLAGCVALVAVYLLIRFLSVKLPLKPFFAGTSLLMYVMCVSFVGSGIKELQEGDAVDVTLLEGWPTVDLLGIYPTVETMVPQAVALVVCMATVVYAVRGWSKKRQEARTASAE